MIATFDMQDFGCSSCAYAIEHLGRKIPGVNAVRVDLAKRVITVRYDGADDVPERIREVVRSIGHDAVLRECWEDGEPGQESVGVWASGGV